MTELHRTRDAVSLIIMSEGGELQAVFCRLPVGYMTYGAGSDVKDLRKDLREIIEPRTRKYRAATSLSQQEH